MKTLGKLFKIELLLAISFLCIPIFLPLSHGGFLNSISEYQHTSNALIYEALLSISGILLMFDGYSDKLRRYNILFGLALIGVVFFPDNEWRITHDAMAIIFFLGNTFIVTYYTLLLTKFKKIIFSSIIVISLTLFITGIFNLYVAESIGLLSMSYFMFIRYQYRKKQEIIC